MHHYLIAPDFKYTYNGSLTINVFRRLHGEWVNFDAFTLMDPTTLHGFRAAADRWHDLAMEADPRYSEPHPTKEFLLHG